MSDGGKRNVRARGARSTPLPIGPALRGLIASFLQHRGVMSMVDSGMLAVEDLDSAQREAVRASLNLRERYQQNMTAAFGPLPPHLRDHVTSFYDIDMARNQQRTGVLTDLEPDMVRASAATRKNLGAQRPMHLEILTAVDADVVDIDTSRVTALTTRCTNFRAPIDDSRITQLKLACSEPFDPAFFSRFPNLEGLVVHYYGMRSIRIDLAVVPKLRKLEVEGQCLRVVVPHDNKLVYVSATLATLSFSDRPSPYLREMRLWGSWRNEVLDLAVFPELRKLEVDGAVHLVMTPGNKLVSLNTKNVKVTFRDGADSCLRELTMVCNKQETVHLPLIRNLNYFCFNGGGLDMLGLDATKVKIDLELDFNLHSIAPRVRDLTLRVSGYPPPLSVFPNLTDLDLVYGDFEVCDLPHLRKLRVRHFFERLGDGLDALEELRVGFIERDAIELARIDVTRFPRLRVLKTLQSGAIVRGSPSVEVLECALPIPEGFTGVEELTLSNGRVTAEDLPSDMTALDPFRCEARLRPVIEEHLRALRER